MCNRAVQQLMALQMGSSSALCMGAVTESSAHGQHQGATHVGSCTEAGTWAAAGILLPQNKPNAVIFLQRHANLVNQPFK